MVGASMLCEREVLQMCFNYTSRAEQKSGMSLVLGDDGVRFRVSLFDEMNAAHSGIGNVLTAVMFD